jgi:multidrug efflux system membrane fusion protein
VFANEEHELFPNQFVNAQLLLDTKHGATLVPSAAVQRGPLGPFVYLVNEDRSVAVRPVTVGVSHAEDSAIESGLSPSEVVVVDGTEKLREGTKVEIRTPGQPPAQVPAAERPDSRGLSARPPT